MFISFLNIEEIFSKKQAAGIQAPQAYRDTGTLAAELAAEQLATLQTLSRRALPCFAVLFQTFRIEAEDQKRRLFE